MVRYRNLQAAIPYVLPGALLVFVFIYLPVVMSFAFSLYRWSAFSVKKVYVGFAYYHRLLSDPIFYTALQNNGLYAVISIVCQVGLGLVLAAILEEKLFRKHQPFFRTVYFVPSVISFTVIGLLWQMLYNPDIGIVNAALRGVGLEVLALGWLGDSRVAIYAVIAVSQWQYTGYIMMLFLVAIQKIPPELYEAAMIDGANRVQSFFHVTVPQVKAMIVVNMAITVIGAFKVFDEIYIMTGGGPGRSTEVLATYLYRSAFRNDEMGFANAIGCVIFLLTFALSVLQLRLSRVGRVE